MLRLLVIALLALGVAGMPAQGTPSIVGTWRLVSMVSPDSSGGATPYWDDHPSGLIIYTADGHVAAQLYDTRRPRLGVPWEQADAALVRTAFVGLATYFGRYTIDASASTISHTVEGAWRPIGSAPTSYAAIASLDQTASNCA